MIQATPRPFPKKSFWTLVVLTLLIAAALICLRSFSGYLNERINLSPDMPNVAQVLAVALGVMVWTAWLILWARKWLIGALVFLIPTVWMVLFHPILSGDAEILGWEPRFWINDSTRLKSEPDAGLTSPTADFKSQTDFDFPQFLGRQRDGVVHQLNLARNWTTHRPRQLWKQPIGEGWSGFAAVNGFAVTQEQQGANECVSCYEIETGKLVWIHSAVRRHEDTVGLGKVGPRATPTIHDGLIYVMGATGVLECLDGADGKLVWSADIPALVGITHITRTNSRGFSFTNENSTLAWGRSGSPLIFEDLVIVPAGGPQVDDQQRTATLIAFDKTSGREVWRGGSLPIAYGSPSLAEIDGQLQILLVAESNAVGHDPRTGAELWRHRRIGNSNADANCSQVMFLGGTRLLLSKGYSMGGEIVELRRGGAAGETSTDKSDAWQAVSLKADPRILKTKLTSPVILGQHAFCLSDGYLECSQLVGDDQDDAKSMLLRKWKQRGRFGNGQLLLIDDLLLVHSEDGELFLVEANPDSYQSLGSIKTISGICWNTICVYKNRVLVRSEKEAACFELPTQTAN